MLWKVVVCGTVEILHKCRLSIGCYHSYGGVWAEVHWRDKIVDAFRRWRLKTIVARPFLCALHSCSPSFFILAPLSPSLFSPYHPTHKSSCGTDESLPSSKVKIRMFRRASDEKSTVFLPALKCTKNRLTLFCTFRGWNCMRTFRHLHNCTLLLYFAVRLNA